MTEIRNDASQGRGAVRGDYDRDYVEQDVSRSRPGRPEVRVAIVGVGNCAASLVQGVAHYSVPGQSQAGLMHDKVGPYEARHITFAAAFDVDLAKVGQPLTKAITAGRNNTAPFFDDWDNVQRPEAFDCTVQAGPRLDGVGSKYAERIDVFEDDGNDDSALRQRIVEHLVAQNVDVILNYLPVGSQQATEWWAAVAIDAGCAFVNNIPVFIARDQTWRERFRQAGLPLIGDDIKSQLGATYVHRILARAFADRGIHLDRTYQLNVGGNMDFYNMLEQSRLKSKKISKAGAVTSALPYEMDPADVHIGPSDYVEWLGDHKLAFIRCEGTAFGGVPLQIELRMDVWDSPNSAGVVIDACRVAKLAMDRGQIDVDRHASAWLFKAPPFPRDDDHEALTALNQWMNA